MIIEAGNKLEGFAAGIQKGGSLTKPDLLKRFQTVGHESRADNQHFFTPASARRMTSSVVGGFSQLSTPSLD
jgi:hypothetical protein